jgi:hypothetical protein
MAKRQRASDDDGVRHAKRYHYDPKRPREGDAMGGPAPKRVCIVAVARAAPAPPVLHGGDWSELSERQFIYTYYAALNACVRAAFCERHC